VLAMLSEAPGQTLRMTGLARQTNATLPRLSHVVTRLENRRLVERFPCPEDRRATNARLTAAGWEKVQEAAPGHAANVRHHVIDALTDEQIDQLAAIGDAILSRLDPSGDMADIYTRYDGAAAPEAG
jgi:DNA-binding MarR family transcriptional regulator